MELSNKALAFLADAVRARREDFARRAEQSTDEDEIADLTNDAAFLGAILGDLEAETLRRRAAWSQD